MKKTNKVAISCLLIGTLSVCLWLAALAQSTAEGNGSLLYQLYLPLIHNPDGAMVATDELSTTTVSVIEPTAALTLTQSAVITSVIDSTQAVMASATVNLIDNRVFDWRFYVNNYADLLQAGILTKGAAETHWRTYGINEGRQAHPGFHTRQYLDLYADIRAAYGANNYRGALEHYLIHGYNEHRQGYVEGGANGRYGRWTVRNNLIYVSTSKRTAGAVDSIFWGGREFLNSYDHGRQLQVAMNKDNLPSECYNPTQAGSEADSIKATSTSLLEAIRASGSTLATQVLPAFWLAPGVKSPYCTLPTGALNKTLRSAYRMNTDVQVGYAGLPNVIQFLTQIYIPERVSSLVIEAPTGYLAGDFTSFYTYVPASQNLTALSTKLAPGEQGLPLILATGDGRYAMGAWSPDLPQRGEQPYGYGQFRFPSASGANDAWATMKWTVVYRTDQVNAGTALHFRTYIAVGSLNDVKSMLTQLYRKIK